MDNYYILNDNNDYLLHPNKKHVIESRIWKINDGYIIKQRM